MNKPPPLQHIPPRLLSLDSSLLEAARLHGTPLYVYDLDTIEESVRHLRKLLPAQSSLLYSLKANPNQVLVENFVRLGLGLEVCSSGELKVALDAGVDPAQVIVAGPGKDGDLLSNSVRGHVGFVALESELEFRRAKGLAAQHAARLSVLLRINLTHSGGGLLNMGGVTQFGMDEFSASELIKLGKGDKQILISGLHGYLGTGILQSRTIINNTANLLESFAKLQHDTDWTCEAVDVGGGLGIPYFAGDHSLDSEELSAGLEEVICSYLHSFPGQRVYFESGRFLVGPSGVFMTTVLDVKSIRGQIFVIVDGGTNCFDLGSQYFGIRPLPMRILGRGSAKGARAVTICGPLCTPTDRLATDVLLPEVEVGDVVAFFQAGAYGLTAARNLFLSHASPAETLLETGEVRLIRKRFNGRVD